MRARDWIVFDAYTFGQLPDISSRKGRCHVKNTPRNSKHLKDARSILSSAVVLETLEARALLSAITHFDSRGAGGGGALFALSISPTNSNEIFMASDLSAEYHTQNLG